MISVIQFLVGSRRPDCSVCRPRDPTITVRRIVGRPSGSAILSIGYDREVGSTDGSVDAMTKPVVEDLQDPVLYEKRGAVAVITMNRPRYANAQNDHMTYELDRAFSRAGNDDEVGAIVLRGEGKHFSSGHDLGTPSTGFQATADDRVTPWIISRASRAASECIRASRRSIWACAVAGATCPNRPWPRCRAGASPGALCWLGSAI